MHDTTVAHDSNMTLGRSATQTSFFGVELGDGFEVVLGPGVMDQPGSEAVGIGADADINISKLFATTERWRPTLEV